MKFVKIFQKFTTLSFVIGISTFSLAEEVSPLQILNEMKQAEKSQSYERLFVQITPNNLETFRYRHTNVNDAEYAQLLNLDGSVQEILQRGNLVAYLSTHYQPFTIHSNQIIDNLPASLHANFENLSKNYDFIAVGRNRVANRTVQIVKILPKDNFRYQCILFIDEDSHLLLRSDLVDQDGQTLEQFRTVNLQLSDELNQLSILLNDFRFPPFIIPDPKNVSPVVKHSWHTSWLPQGFKMINMSNDNEKEIIETQIYSDGLFSFTLYVSKAQLPENYENSWRQGGQTIYTETLAGKEITLIGQIPLSTAKRIVQEIKFGK